MAAHAAAWGGAESHAVAIGMLALIRAPAGIAQHSFAAFPSQR